jgi:phage terminase large subunit-like protein
MYKLNDTPSVHCCEWQTWDYAVTMDGEINATDKLVVYIWNREKQNFLVDDLKVEVYNYNYEQ